MKRPNYVFDDELYHHGILGQKWGDRRFQNEDGSWTPEGRERYGKGDDTRTKAKNTYNTQKYKADLKSKAKQDKATRSAKEERHSIKENAKTMRLARKEQGRFDRLNKKENAKLDNSNKGLLKFSKTKDMSDDDLQKAVDRLKLQAEYNKQYALATHPNSALAKADRFFEGPTGKAVTQVAVAVLPNVVNTAVTKLLENKLKYTNELDAKEQEANIEKKKIEIEKTRTEMEDAHRKAQVDWAGKVAKNKQARTEMEDAHRKAQVDWAGKVAENKQKVFGSNNVSDIPKTVAPDIPKTVRPYAWDIPKTTSVPISSIPKTVAPQSVKLLPSKATSVPVSNIAGYLPSKVKKYNK